MVARLGDRKVRANAVHSSPSPSHRAACRSRIVPDRLDQIATAMTTATATRATQPASVRSPAIGHETTRAAMTRKRASGPSAPGSPPP